MNKTSAGTMTRNSLLIFTLTFDNKFNQNIANGKLNISMSFTIKILGKYLNNLAEAPVFLDLRQKIFCTCSI